MSPVVVAPTTTSHPTSSAAAAPTATEAVPPSPTVLFTVALPAGWTRLNLTDPAVRLEMASAGVPADSALFAPGTFFAYVTQYGDPLDSAAPVTIEITADPAPAGATLDSLMSSLVAGIASIEPPSESPVVSHVVLPAGDAVRIEYVNQSAGADGVEYLMLVSGRKVLASCLATTAARRQAEAPDYDAIMRSFVLASR